MIQDDYLLRLIARFAEGISRIAAHKKQGDFAKAQEEAGEIINDVFGLRPDFFQTLSEYELQSALRAGKTFNAHKALMLAQLLSEQAEIAWKSGSKEHECVPLLITSLNVYIEALLDTRELRTDEHIQTISQLLQKLDDYDLPMEVLENLMDYHQTLGNFSDAENVLYELLETDEEHALQKGRSFYESLLSLTDEDLDAGDLPRSEVEEGLKMVEERSYC